MEGILNKDPGAKPDETPSPPTKTEIRSALEGLRRSNEQQQLLLPGPMFAPRLRKREPTLEAVRDLSGIFRASLTATARRVVELGAHPAMVICSSSVKREWYKASGEIDGRLRPHRYLSKDSLAYELLRKPGFPEVVDEVDAWIHHPDAADYVLVESSVKVTPELVITVLWWKDEAQILDLGDDE